MPFVGLYIQKLGGTDTQVPPWCWSAQAVMMPVALASRPAGDRWGRKPVFAIGFLAVAGADFALFVDDNRRGCWWPCKRWTASAPGIYGVVIVAMCADLTRARAASTPCKA